jgi:hypothetical protein
MLKKTVNSPSLKSGSDWRFNVRQSINGSIGSFERYAFLHSAKTEFVTIVELYCSSQLTVLDLGINFSTRLIHFVAAFPSRVEIGVPV